jgi:hypothetical protein
MSRQIMSLHRVPDVIVTKCPKLKKYRYVRVGKRIAVVSPSTRKIVKFID